MRGSVYPSGLRYSWARPSRVNIPPLKNLSICHVLEFEDIYREEALKRARAGTPVPNGHRGRSTVFMSRDAAASEMSVARVLYIKAQLSGGKG